MRYSYKGVSRGITWITYVRPLGSGAHFDIRLARLYVMFWEALPSFNELHNSFKGPSGSIKVFKLAYEAPGGGGDLWGPKVTPSQIKISSDLDRYF